MGFDTGFGIYHFSIDVISAPRMWGITTAAELQALPGNTSHSKILVSSGVIMCPSGAWSPLFDLCHYLLAALAVRSEVGQARSRAQPLATWMATMSASFAGSLLANPLMGKPVLAAVSNEYQVRDVQTDLDMTGEM